MEERIVAPDPVREPDAYKQALLDLVGGDDPLDVLARTAQLFEDLTKDLSAEVLSRRPEPKEWSVHELLGHFFDAEIVYAFRWRLVLAQDDPTLIGYDQDAWTTLRRPPFNDMLFAFTALRRANLAMLRATDESLWDRSGRHEERGEESVRLGVALIAGHDRAHLKQLEQTIAAVT